jgi:hypothetical protein
MPGAARLNRNVYFKGGVGLVNQLLTVNSHRSKYLLIPGAKIVKVSIA